MGGEKRQVANRVGFGRVIGLKSRPTCPTCHKRLSGSGVWNTKDAKNAWRAEDGIYPAEAVIAVITAH